MTPAAPGMSRYWRPRRQRRPIRRWSSPSGTTVRHARAYLFFGAMRPWQQFLVAPLFSRCSAGIRMGDGTSLRTRTEWRLNTAQATALDEHHPGDCTGDRPGADAGVGIELGTGGIEVVASLARLRQ